MYFSEKLTDPNDPTSAIEFYLTLDGQEPKMFDMSSDIPNIVAQQGTVEDWIIENRSRELHAFHIHQLHFLLLDYSGRQVSEDFLRDTVNVPYYDGHSLAYPNVRLRMDFRDRSVTLREGEFIIVPRGVEHRPVAEQEVEVMLFEPAQIKHTGDVESELTVHEFERI